MKDFFDLLKTLQQIDKCTSARQEKNPLPCEFTKLGTLEYCKIHKGLKVNQ